MNARGQRRAGCVAVLAAYIAAIIAAAALLWGCATTRYVPVETVRTEKEEVTKWRVDTVSQGDTRFVYVKGDTVIDWRDRWRERVREVHDTLYIERTDSVAVPYPVEKPLSKWERAKVDWGGWAIGALAVVVTTLVWLWKRKR